MSGFWYDESDTEEGLFEEDIGEFHGSAEQWLFAEDAEYTEFGGDFGGRLPRPKTNDVTQAVTAVINMIPALVQSIASEGEGTWGGLAEWEYETIENLLWEAQPVETSDEAWGAIIGAIASAIPAIIPVVRDLVNAGKKQPRGPAPAPTRRPSTPPRPPATAHCPPTRQRESEITEELIREHGLDAQEAAGVASALTTILPILIQVLPAVLPLIMELLKTGLPLLTNMLQAGAKAPAAAKGTSRREDYLSGGETSEVEYEGDPLYL